LETGRGLEVPQLSLFSIMVLSMLVLATFRLRPIFWL